MFLTAFSKSSVKVLIIESQNQIRAMMFAVLKELHYTVRAVHDMKEALSMLEVEPFDWVLMPPSLDANVSCMTLLGHAIRYPRWRATAVSLLISESEYKAAMSAMEYGCLSWHLGPFTRETFLAEIKALDELAFKFGYFSDLISAKYLRDLAIKSHSTNLLKSLEQSLVNLHPANLNVLMDSGESCRKIGAFEDSLLYFNQAKLLEDPKAKRVEKIILEVQTEITKSNYELKSIITNCDILGFESAVIVDPDSTVQQFISKILKEHGIEKIDVFSDGESFFEWFKTNEPDFVIMEWKIPKLSAAKILQRNSVRGERKPPQFIIATASIKPEDMPLLKELGVASALSKPYSHNDLMAAFLTARAGLRLHSGIYFEQRIRSLIRAKKMDKASELAKDFFEDPQVDPSRKMLIQADCHLASKNFEKARDVAMKAMTTQHDSTYGLQVLGKAFMGLRQFDYAMKCFDRAQALSPQNVERMCLMAVAEAEQGNFPAANDLMKSAVQADSKNELVLDTVVNVAMVQNDLATAKKAISDLPNMMGIVAFQNNRAVALAKSKRVNESIDVYIKTLQVLPDQAREAKDVVLWNLALAYIKNEDLNAADESLKKIGSLGETRVTKKAAALRRKMAKAVSAGQKFELNTTERDRADSPGTASTALVQPIGANVTIAASEDFSPLSTDAIKMLPIIDLKPGDLGCFLMVKTENSKFNVLEKFLNSLPTIKAKWQIAPPGKKSQLVQ